MLTQATYVAIHGQVLVVTQRVISQTEEVLAMMVLLIQTL